MEKRVLKSSTIGLTGYLMLFLWNIKEAEN